MSLALMTEKTNQVRKTNRGREDEPSIFEFTSNHPGGETLIPGLRNSDGYWEVLPRIELLQYFHHVRGGVEYRLLQHDP